MEKEIIDLLSYVKTSEHRRRVLMVLNDRILLSSELSKESNISRAHTSRALRGLQDNNLVKCLNEEKTRGRLFVTTDLGKEIIKYIK